jgi:hypothetical protein
VSFPSCSLFFLLNLFEQMRLGLLSSIIQSPNYDIQDTSASLQV